MADTVTEEQPPAYPLLGRFVDDHLRAWRDDLETDEAVVRAMIETGLIDENSPPDRSTVSRWRSGKNKPKRHYVQALAEVLLESKHIHDVSIIEIDGAISFLSDKASNLERWHHRPDVPKLVVPYLEEAWPTPSVSSTSFQATTTATLVSPESGTSVGRAKWAASFLAIAAVLAVVYVQVTAQETPAAVAAEGPENGVPIQSVDIGGSADGASINQTVISGD